MGYYTRYQLDVVLGNPDEIDQFWENLDNQKCGDGLYYAVGRDGSSGDSCKWYEYEGDMRDMSKQYPSILFKLTGEREESGDLWIEYYRNGEMQRCEAKITYDPFDENQLR